MNYIKANPGNKKLKKYIHNFYVIEVELEDGCIPGVGKVDKSVYSPCGTPEIIYNYSNGSIFFHGHRSSLELKPKCSMVLGQLTRSVNIEYPARVKLFGIRFKPYGLIPFLDSKKIPGLIDNMWPASKIFGSGAEKITGQITPETSVDEFALIMSGFLIEIFDDSGYLYDDLFKIIDDYSLVENISSDIEALADRFKCSRQYFSKIFKSVTGINPKAFQRVVRMAIFRDIINRGYQGNIISLILSLGYFDQSHFCKEFKNITGMRPNLFMENDARFSREC